MAKEIKFSTIEYNPERGRESDLGIDMPACGVHIIKPGDVKTINTGLSFEFPQFTKLQRFIWRLLFGIDVTGVGTLVWPKGRSEHAILAGVIDVEYRGEVKIKVYNPTDEILLFNAGDMIAQMVPVLALNIPLTKITQVNLNTDRGTSGGINR